MNKRRFGLGVMLIQANIKFYLIFIYSLLFRFVYGFTLKSNCLIVFVKPFYLVFLLVALKLSSITSLSALLDIVVQDNPNQRHYRFSLTYVFVSYLTKTRIFLKIFNNGVIPVISLSNFYKSSN